MVNESIRIGLANDVSSLRRLSLLSYNQLAQYDSPSCYKLSAISRAAGILAARKKSLKRVAAINLARRGRVRFARSRPPIVEAQGGAVEAVKGNPTPTAIPGVDAPKPTHPTKS